MQTFFQQVVSGASNGAIYASLALALVLIYKGTHVLNASQGELALISAYVGYSFINAGIPLLLVFPLVMIIAFAFGILLRIVVAPIQNSPAGLLGVLIVTLGLFLGLNNLDGVIWGQLPKAFPSPFPDGILFVGGVAIRKHQIGLVAVIGVVLLVLMLFFSKARTGLYMRAVAENPVSARLAGIPVGRMLALAWGLASAVGALAGMLIAHTTFLSPQIMFGVLIWSLAAAILGGFDSPVGAIVGGLIVGIIESLSSFYIDFIGSDLKLVAAVAVIIIVVLVRPQGLFGTPEVQRL